MFNYKILVKWEQTFNCCIVEIAQKEFCKYQYWNYYLTMVSLMIWPLYWKKLISVILRIINILFSLNKPPPKKKTGNTNIATFNNPFSVRSCYYTNETENSVFLLKVMTQLSCLSTQRPHLSYSHALTCLSFRHHSTSISGSFNNLVEIKAVEPQVSAICSLLLIISFNILFFITNCNLCTDASENSPYVTRNSNNVVS